MIDDPDLSKAVSQIAERAERERDADVLIRTFVDTGAMTRLQNRTNQIVFGRRGSGKTHVLRVLSESAPPDHLALYLDCRVLASSGRTLEAASLRTQGLAVFRDILHELGDALLDRVVAIEDPDNGNRALEALQAFTDEVVGARYTVSGDVSTETTAEATAGRSASAGLQFGTQTSLNLGGSSEHADVAREVVRSTQQLDDRLSFASLHSLLNKTLDASGIDTILLLIDEWAEVDPDAQPYLADYLKKAFFANNRVVIKVASLEYRSRFGATDNGRSVGLEIGGDIFANTDLDDYFLPDRSPGEVNEAYALLLVKHLASHLPEGALQRLGLDETNLPSRMFTQYTVFQELVRASEGVPRDFINIFNSAFFDAKRRGRSTIDMEAIHRGARNWYESDKRQNLSPPQEALLHRIVNEVIGTRRARCFMLEQGASRHAVIRQLYDLRVIHRLRAGYSGRDRPGVRYDVFTLDYGTYVDLKNTAAEPEEGFVAGEESEEFAVPFNDQRSIRRIILDPAVLDEAP